MRNVTFVPEGRNDGSQAIYCLVCVPRPNPSRRERFDFAAPGSATSQSKKDASSQPITPYPTGRFFFERIPGSKLPGYHRPVPTGQETEFMSTASHQLTGPIDNDPKDEFFHVIHPLDDLPEEKVKSDHLPPLKMTRSVRWSLFTLRAYLIIMMLLLFYHVFDLARQVWR